MRFIVVVESALQANNSVDEKAFAEAVQMNVDKFGTAEHFLILSCDNKAIA